MSNMEVIKVDFWHEYIEEHPNFTGCLINQDNNKAWYKNGQRHREDGPAIEFADGSKRWHLNDKYYSEQDWKIALRKIKLERVLKKING